MKKQQKIRNRKWSKILYPTFALGLATAITIPFVTSCSSNSNNSNNTNTSGINWNALQKYGYNTSTMNTTALKQNFIEGYNMWNNAGLQMLQTNTNYTFRDLMNILGSWSNIMDDAEVPDLNSSTNSLTNFTSSQLQYMKLSGVYARAIIMYNNYATGLYPTPSELYNEGLSSFVNGQIAAMYYLISELLAEVNYYVPSYASFTLPTSFTATINSSDYNQLINNLNNLTVSFSSFSNMEASFQEAGTEIGIYYNIFGSDTNLLSRDVFSTSQVNSVITLQTLLQYFAPYISSSIGMMQTYLSNGYQWMNTWSNGDAFTSSGKSNIGSLTPSLTFYSGWATTNPSVPSEVSNQQYFNSSWGTVSSLWNPYDYENALPQGVGTVEAQDLKSNVSYSYLDNNESIFGGIINSSNASSDSSVKLASSSSSSSSSSTSSKSLSNNGDMFSTQMFDSNGGEYINYTGNSVVYIFLQANVQQDNIASSSLLNSVSNTSSFLNQDIDLMIGNVFPSDTTNPELLSGHYWFTTLNEGGYGTGFTSNLDSLLWQYIINDGYNGIFSSNSDGNSSGNSSVNPILTFNILNNFNNGLKQISFSTNQELISLIQAFSLSGLTEYNFGKLNLNGGDASNFSDFTGVNTLMQQYNPTSSDYIPPEVYTSYAQYINQLYLSYYVTGVDNSMGITDGISNISNTIWTISQPDAMMTSLTKQLSQQQTQAINLAQDLQYMLGRFYNITATSTNSTPTLMQFRLMNGSVYNSTDYTLVQVQVHKINALSTETDLTSNLGTMANTGGVTIPTIGYNNSGVVTDPYSNFYYVTFNVSQSTTPVYNTSGNAVTSAFVNPFVTSSSSTSNSFTLPTTNFSYALHHITKHNSTISSQIILSTIIDKNTNALTISKLI